MNNLLLCALYKAGIKSLYDLNVFKHMMFFGALICVPTAIVGIILGVEGWWLFCVFGAIYSYIATVVHKELKKYP